MAIPVDKAILSEYLTRQDYEGARTYLQNIFAQQFDQDGRTLPIIDTASLQSPDFIQKSYKLLEGDTIFISRSRAKLAYWLILCLTLAACGLFGYIFDHFDTGIIVLSALGLAGTLLFGWTLLDRKPKIIITRKQIVNNYDGQSIVNIDDILATYLYKFKEYKHDSDKLLIFKKSSANYEEWFLADLEYEPEFTAMLIENRKVKM